MAGATVDSGGGGGNRGAMALVRHWPAEVAAGLCYGRLDVPLRPVEAEAVARLRAALGRPVAVWCSPARRCRQTLALLAGADWPGPVFDADLLELDFGAWEGRAWDDVPRAEIDAWATDLVGRAPPGGESGGALLARVERFAGRLGAGGLVVGHGGPLKLLAALLEGRAPDLAAPAQGPGSVVWPRPG